MQTENNGTSNELLSYVASNGTAHSRASKKWASHGRRVRRRRAFWPIAMMVVGLFILGLSAAAYVYDRYSFILPYGAETAQEAGVFILDDQHGMGCHFNLHTPMMECMTDEQWEGRDIEREAQYLREMNEHLRELIDQREEELEWEIWEILHKQGKVWKA